MEWFTIMVAPELVVVGAVLFLFIYAAKYKDRAE
ncbi:cytochrome bd oxidase small subunit CydS [Paenibacillus rubinfantis]